ncbi:MAG: PKD domain-containing protein [Flavobacteriales bacterium]|nr:PKD domain-containing protein [Flavobacteriales bacterium]
MKFLKIVGWSKFLVFFLLVSKSIELKACTGLNLNISINQSGNCIPKTVSIQNNTTGANASTAVYKLYVNNTYFDSAVGNSKTFVLSLNRGTFSIKIKATIAGGCADSVISSVVVTNPLAEFNDFINGYSDKPEWINCIQQSTDPDSFNVEAAPKDSLLALHVLWGDGATSSYGNLKKDSIVGHTFPKTGVFTIKFVTTDLNGCVDTTYGTLINERIPTAGIIGPSSGFNVGCAPFSVNFVNNSSNISNGTVFDWDFGNGTKAKFGSNTFKDTIKFIYTGTLCNGTVKLTASNVCGYSQTTWNPIHISQKDKAIFTIDSSNCDPSGVYTFINKSSDSFCLVPDPKQYYWDFGDGTKSGWITGKSNITHNYATEGPKTVYLVAKNKCGEDTMRQVFNVVYTPIPGFVHDTLAGCATAKVNVRDTSIGYGLTRVWQWGDGNTGNSKIDAHTYFGRGNYNLKLLVSNRCGTKSVTKQVVVKDKPTASFSGVTNGCVSHTLNLSNISSTDFTNSATYFWRFGNGDTSILKNPPFITYSDSGKYQLMLVVADTCGIDTAKQNLFVYKVPTIDVSTGGAVCSLDTMFFDNKSIDYDFLVINYGDGTTPDSVYSGINRFGHVFTKSGNFSVIVSAVNKTICQSKDTLQVTIKPNSLAKLKLSDTALCAPATFYMQNQSIDASVFRWFVDGTLVSTNKEIDSLIIGTDTTIKRVKLVADNTIGCRADSVEQVFLTSKNPTAVIGNPMDSGCGPLVDTFLNHSLHAANYVWNFGNGTTSTLDEPTATFNLKSNGDTIYQIQLIAKNWMGCADTALAFRKVFPNPIADFSMDTSNGCFPLLVTFTNLSSPNGTGNPADMKYFWDLGNGGTDTAQHPTNVLYYDSKTIDSVYTVSLSIKSTNGCSASKRSNITVYPKPTVDFSLSQTEGCGPFEPNITNISKPNNFGSIGIMTFDWDFGNGQTSVFQNPSASFRANPVKDTFYTLKLIGYSEHLCADSMQKTVQVFPKPLSSFSLDTNKGCSPLSVQFTNNSVPYDTSSIGDMSFFWSFGNANTSAQTNATETFYETAFANKEYNIQLIAISEHGCRDTAYDTVTVFPTPNAVFTQDKTQGCGPLLVNFKNNSQLNNQNFWNLGSGFSSSPADTAFLFPFVRLMDTTYTVLLFTKSQNGCQSDTAIRTVTVFAQPIADFQPVFDSICWYDEFNFTNNSNGAVFYSWDFGDGVSSTSSSPNYQYKKGSDAYTGLDFEVRLEASSSRNCKDTAIDSVYVYPFTVAQILNNLDSFCSPAVINFINGSQNYSQSLWNFGNENTSTQSQPSFFYQNISNVTKDLMVSLQTTNTFGCVDNDTIRFKIIPEPTADFSPFRMDVCDSGYFSMVNRSINNVSNNWDFGNGKTSNLAEPSLLLVRNRNATANYPVRLIVKNTAGCPDTAIHVVSVNPIMTVDFDTSVISNLCVEDNVAFKNRSKFAVYHKWTFGDGAESRDSMPVYFYKKGGVFSVKYIGYDINGCPDSIEKKAMITVYDRPKANFIFDPINAKMPNSTVSFTDVSISSIGLTYSWNFDDGGATSTQKYPSHTFSDSGIYYVQLLVDNGFCTDTITKPVIIEPYLPIPFFTADNVAGCSPLIVNFSNQSLYANRYRWFFDDGSESDLENPSHSFVYEGKYDIKLVAYGPGGEADTTAQQMITVHPNPMALFNISPTERYLPNAQFAADNQSIGAVTYLWNVSNQNGIWYDSSHKKSPVFQLNASGVFNIDLQVENQFGCRDTFNRPLYITVHDGGKIFIPSAFSPSELNQLNDYFMPVMTGVDPNGYLFRIFNRWGEKIFETTDINMAWDGTYKGRMSEMEQYVFTIDGQFYSGQQFNERGTVYLMR